MLLSLEAPLKILSKVVGPLSSRLGLPTVNIKISRTLGVIADKKKNKETTTQAGASEFKELEIER